MENSNKPASVRGIPNVKGVYAVRLEENSFEILLAKEDDPAAITRQLGTTGSRASCLKHLLEKICRQFTKKNPEVRFHDSPVPVLLPQELSAANYRIVELAPGLVVAYSSFFVAWFSTRFGCWFLRGIALTPDFYISVSLGKFERIQVELAWFGKGVKALKFFWLPGNEPMNHKERLCLITIPPELRHTAEKTGVFNSLWMVTEDNGLHLSCKDHSYRLTRKGEGWVWKVSECREVSEPEFCIMKELDWVVAISCDRVRLHLD